MDMKLIEMLTEDRCPVTFQTRLGVLLWEGWSNRPRIMLSSGMLYSCPSDETREVILRQRKRFSECASRGFSCSENCCWNEAEDGLTKVNLGVSPQSDYVTSRTW